MFIVTGANGFIGSAMVRELNKLGIEDILCVDVIDRAERQEPLAKAKYHEFFTTKNFINWASKNISSKQIQCIFHMGAISATTETVWERLKENNIELSQLLRTFSQKWNCPFIYASSGAVYGQGEHGFKDTADTRIYKPLNLYGRSKQEFDIWINDQPQDTNPWYGLRFFNVYGPNEYHKGDMASVVYKAFIQIKTNGHLKLFKSHNPQYKDGEQLRDFIYVKDITYWMWELYKKGNVPSGIYNMGYGTPRSWLDLAKCTFAAMESPLNIDWIDIPANIREQYQYITHADMNKTFSAGLNKPMFSLEAGINDYVTQYLMTDDPYL